ncbi:Hypothetical predicted protein [Cloeon dipterum]|uniref:Gustatory receptor n=1 Tax=Cloeon dipterum TaxID=197152 RepID=A0A8S1D5W3_9INSE|nr:Hypothetical predicted protein [Cloeon dipterum]
MHLLRCVLLLKCTGSLLVVGLRIGQFSECRVQTRVLIATFFACCNWPYVHRIYFDLLRSRNGFLPRHLVSWFTKVLYQVMVPLLLHFVVRSTPRVAALLNQLAELRRKLQSPENSDRNFIFAASVYFAVLVWTETYTYWGEFSLIISYTAVSFFVSSFFFQICFFVTLFADLYKEINEKLCAERINIKTLRHLNVYLENLHELWEEFHRLFGFLALILILDYALYFMTVACGITERLITCYFLKACSSEQTSYIYNNLCWTYLNLFIILYIVKLSSDLEIEEAYTAVYYSALAVSFANEVYSRKPPQFTAWGLFPVNYQLLFAAGGSCATNMAILMQAHILSLKK